MATEKVMVEMELPSTSDMKIHRPSATCIAMEPAFYAGVCLGPFITTKVLVDDGTAVTTKSERKFRLIVRPNGNLQVKEAK